MGAASGQSAFGQLQRGSGHTNYDGQRRCYVGSKSPPTEPLLRNLVFGL